MVLALLPMSICTCLELGGSAERMAHMEGLQVTDLQGHRTPRRVTYYVYVALGKLAVCFCLNFSICKMGVMTVPTSWYI